MGRSSVVLLACAAALAPAPAFAWGATGHRIIGEAAIAALPGTVPAFLRTDEVAREVGELAREPDRWRGAGPTHDGDRDPGHYVDLSDDLTVLGGPPLDALPETRRDYDTALRSVGSTQYKAGYLPYSIIDGFEQLKIDFAYWRADVAGIKFAKTDDARAWLDRDRALHEMLVVRDLGVWAHYVGDGSQPLHVSVHFDGWGEYPNPGGYSNHHGIHAYFESAFVRANVVGADVTAALPQPRDCGCAIEKRTAQYLAASSAQVIPFYGLEKQGAFATATPAGKLFAVTQLAAGAAELRDLIVMAWAESSDAMIGYPPIAVGDVESGTVDPLPPLRGED
jgi:hypothetical protein